jgi:hypothetical protein
MVGWVIGLLGHWAILRGDRGDTDIMRHVTLVPSVQLFERDLPEGWVYPCTLEDIKNQLERIPATDLEGIWSIGLVPATRRDNAADARYFGGDKPTIHIYSFPSTMVFKQPAHAKRSGIENGLRKEIAFGMEIEQRGSRWFCRWQPENLHRFVLEHVLPHEIGHHVYHKTHNVRGGLCRNRASCEQFAEAYARRISRLTHFE